MALAKRSAAYYNGLDKKYDKDGFSHSQSWQPTSRMRPWMMIRKRRIFLALIAMGLVYLFFKNMPTDVPSVGIRSDPLTGLNRARMPMSSRPIAQGDSFKSIANDELYDGPVKFYNLASTLRDHANVLEKENVVIPLHDLRSTTSLTGLACDIARHERTSVHVVLLCPQETTIEEIVRVSGIQQQKCPVFWHDARPDYHAQSSLARRKTTFEAVMGHLHAYLSPVAVIIDEQQAKDTTFVQGLRLGLDRTWTPLSIVPDDALTSMNWITALDGRGLSLLNQIQIDIIITPFQFSSGTLIRLLKSIQSAHYDGLPFPRITIEIPPNIDTFALHFLESFRWPTDSPTSPSKMILRKRLDTSKLTPSMTSIRTLESFYPPSHPMSHVLVLSPIVELSPDYLQYLYYITLEYKYGSKGKDITEALMGISLDIASHGSKLKDDQSSPWANLKNEPLVLVQSPSATATLYFGDKWVELQDYLSLRLQHDTELSRTVSEEVETQDKVSSDKPAWLTPALELMRARNYYALSPTLAQNPEDKLIVVHTEADQTPEEFSLPKPPISSKIPPPPLDKNTILTGENPVFQAEKHHPQASLSSDFLSSLLRQSSHGGLPSDSKIPMYSHNVQTTDWNESILASEKYSEKVSLQVGGCKTLEERDEKKEGRLEYLFCDKDEE